MPALCRLWDRLSLRGRLDFTSGASRHPAMPNLVGICDPTADAVSLGRDLERMLRRVDLPAFGFERRTATGRGLAFGNLLPGIEDNLSQPCRDEDAGTWLLLDGELMGVESLRHDLRARGVDPSGLDDAGLAFAAWRCFGESFVDRLNGTWNLVIGFEREGRALIATDRLGSRILFHAHDGQRLVLANEMKAVIAGRTVESRAGGFGLLELLMGPYQHGDRTWIEGISVIDPGTILRFDRGRLERRRYWRFSFAEGPPPMSEDDAVEGFTARMRGAVSRFSRRRPGLRLGITLSGGLDSRAIALALDRGDRPVAALTYGDEDSADVRYARPLAELCGLDWHYVEAEKARLLDAANTTLDRLVGPARSGRRGFFAAQLDRMVWRDECLGDMTGTTSMIWHPLYARHMDLMLQGACGDALTGSHLGLGLMTGQSRREVMHDLYKGQYFQPREVIEPLLAPRFLDRHWHGREARFVELFDHIDADHPAAVSSIWDMENRQRRGAFSTFGMERYFCAIRAPFLDYELVDFLRSIPPSWRFQQRLYKKMIVRGFPEGAHVPWAYTESRITTSPSYEFAREWANYWKRRVARRLAPKTHQLPNYAFRDNASLLREDPEVWNAVEAWLDSDQFDGEVFRAEGIRALRERLMAGASGEDVVMPYAYFCALARAHRWFLSGEVDTVPPEADPAEFGVRRGG
jgi:asparagine synthase (glutamine-hydrolysing)